MIAALSLDPNTGLFNPELGLIKPKMGTKASSFNKPPAGRISPADALFGNAQQRVLGLLFGQPERSFYANELIALAGSGTGAVQRELARLAGSELVTVRLFGRQKHYQANPQSPIYAELCGIVQKTTGLAEPLRAALSSLAERIRAAFVYGSVAKRTDTASSDIDLLLVSDDLDYGELFMALEDLSRRLGRTVNPTVLSAKELSERLERGEAFLTRVLQQPKIWIIGDEHALGV